MPSYRPVCAIVAVVTLAVSLGCEQKQQVVPFSGKVLFKDQPLTSGSVMFQPEGGIPARGTIGSDGTFTLTTYREGDGATVGKNKVRVVSTSPVGGDASQGELKTGESVIPEFYNDFSTTKLTVDVQPPGQDDAVLVLVE